jgi:hypothetical protein
MIECTVEEHVPIPTGTTQYIDVRVKATAACASAAMLMDEGYSGPNKAADEMRPGISEMLISVANDRKANIDHLINTPKGAMQVRAVLDEFDMEVISNAKQIRNYVTNKLVIESTNMDARIRMKALELLGKLSDVGLFTERSEVTVSNKSTVELENVLKEKLRKLMGTESVSEAVIISEPVHIPRNVDVSAELDGL